MHLAGHRQVGSWIGEAGALHIRAIALAELGKFDEALHDATQTLELYKKTGFHYNERRYSAASPGSTATPDAYSVALEHGAPRPVPGNRIPRHKGNHPHPHRFSRRPTWRSTNWTGHRSTSTKQCTSPKAPATDAHMWTPSSDSPQSTTHAQP